MITKLKRNPKFDVHYHDTYYFEFDRLDDYIEFLRTLSEWTGVITIQSTISTMRYAGNFVVDNYVVPADFYEQITQKKLSL